MIWFSQFLTVNQTDFPATHRFVNEDLSSAVFPRKLPTCIFWLILVYFLFFGWFCFVCFFWLKLRKIYVRAKKLCLYVDVYNSDGLFYTASVLCYC